MNPNLMLLFLQVALAFMGPDWWLKRAVEQLYLDGLRGINLGFLIPKVTVIIKIIELISNLNKLTTSQQLENFLSLRKAFPKLFHQRQF